MKVPLDNTTQRNNQISSEHASSYFVLKKKTSLLMCIVGVNSLLKSQQKTFIWDHRDLSITETEFAKRANVLDKTL